MDYRDSQRPPLRLLLIVIVVGSMVALAGCGTLLGESGPSISEPRTQVSDGTPVFAFNYSVSDYSTALLQGPNGNVIAEANLEPNKTVDGFWLSDPEPGTYKIIIQSGGETIAEKSTTFQGANPRVSTPNASWSNNSLQSVSVTVQNTGDLPVQVINATISARTTNIDTGSLYQWIPANTTETVTLPLTYSDLNVQQPGDVRGNVDVLTSTGTLSGTFSETFNGANLTVVSTTPTWSGSTLKSTSATVANTGDLPTTATVEIYRGNKLLASSWQKEIPPGAQVSYDISPYTNIYETTAGGDISLSLVVNSSSGFTETTVSRYVEPANLSLISVSPKWQNGELISVSYVVENTGETSTEFSSSVTVAGSEVSSTAYTIEAGETGTVTVPSYPSSYDPLYTATSGGQVPVTVSITGAGETLSKTATAEFAAVSGTISSVDTTFLGNYDSDTSDLTGPSFTVKNTGEISLVYDAIEISIDGTTRTVSKYAETALAPGETTTEYVTLSSYITVPNGQHEMTVRLVNNGEVVVTETVTVSTTS